MSSLQEIEWSSESLPLSKFVETYTLPQIVQVNDGYDGGSYENTIANGDILKLHKLITERRLSCETLHGKSYTFPIRGQKILKEKSTIVYHTVADLARANPLPPSVIVTVACSGRQKSDGETVWLKPGDFLEVVEINNPSKLSFKNIVITFRNGKGSLIKLTKNCVAGFQQFSDNKCQMLQDVVPAKPAAATFPFQFTFLDQNVERLGVLKATSSREEQLVMASCEDNGESELIFMISPNLAVSVIVALGTKTYDRNYESVKTLFQHYQSLEEVVKSTTKYKQRDYCSDDVEVYTMLVPNIPVRAPQKNNQRIEKQVTSSVFVEKEFTTTPSSPRPPIPPKTSSSSSDYEDFATTQKPAIPPKRPEKKSSAKQNSETIKVTSPIRKEKAEESPRKLQEKHSSSTTKSNSSQNLETTIKTDEGPPSSLRNPSDRYEIYPTPSSPDRSPVNDSKSEETKRFLPPVPTQSSPTIMKTSETNSKVFDNLKEKVCGNERQSTNDTTLPSQNQYEPLKNFDFKPSDYEELSMETPLINESDQISSLQEIKKMNIKTFSEVLRILHMNQHVENFADNQVNGSLFCELNEEELKDLGLGKFEIKKLLNFKNGWRPT